MLLVHQPRGPLAEFVEVLWLDENRVTPHPRERLLPTGTMEWVINLGEEPLRVFNQRDQRCGESFKAALICGPHTEYFVIDTAQRASVMGVHFKPGGAFPFLRPPAGELRNSHVALDALLGNRAAELRERVLEAKTSAERFRALEQQLPELACRPLSRHPAVDFALTEFAAPPHGAVSEVAAQIGLSWRRFIQAFDQHVGMTPKLYCRVRRFQEVLRLAGSNGRIDWADLAVSCGYYDQAHFIRDFRAFSGLNPTTYLRDRSDHLNHVPLT